MLIESGCGCAACSAPGSATGSTVAWVLCARARPADTTLGSPARNYTQCRAIPALPQARQGLAAVDIGNMTNVTFMTEIITPRRPQRRISCLLLAHLRILAAAAHHPAFRFAGRSVPKSGRHRGPCRASPKRPTTGCSQSSADDARSTTRSARRHHHREHAHLQPAIYRSVSARLAAACSLERSMRAIFAER